MTAQDAKLLQVVELIAGSRPKKLLFDNLRILAVELLRAQHAVDASRRKTRDVRKNLSDITQAAEILLKAMHDVELVSYLNQVGPTAFNYLHILLPGLEDVARRANEITGELPEGPGNQRYKTGEFAIDAMRLCTIIVLEASKIEHENSPSPYNEKLWEAADLLWLASGGADFEAKDSLERWKKHFIEMSRSNITTVRHETVRQILDLQPIDLTKLHKTETGTE